MNKKPKSKRSGTATPSSDAAKEKAIINRKQPDTDITKSVASSTECTGLTASIPYNGSEAAALEDIYPSVPVEPQAKDPAGNGASPSARDRDGKRSRSDCE